MIQTTLTRWTTSPFFSTDLTPPCWNTTLCPPNTSPSTLSHQSSTLPATVSILPSTGSTLLTTSDQDLWPHLHSWPVYLQQSPDCVSPSWSKVVVDCFPAHSNTLDTAFSIGFQVTMSQMSSHNFIIAGLTAESLWSTRTLWWCARSSFLADSNKSTLQSVYIQEFLIGEKSLPSVHWETRSSARQSILPPLCETYATAGDKEEKRGDRYT